MKKLGCLLGCMLVLCCSAVGCRTADKDRIPAASYPAASDSAITEESHSLATDSTAVISHTTDSVTDTASASVTTSTSGTVVTSATSGRTTVTTTALTQKTTTAAEKITTRNENSITTTTTDTTTSRAITTTQSTTRESTADDLIDAQRKVLGQDALHQHRVFNDIGSSRELCGQISVYCYFVNDNESRWTAAECDAFMLEQIRPALAFISAQAKQWQVELTFDVIGYYEPAAEFSLDYDGIVNRDLMNGGSTKDIFNQMAVNMGYEYDCAFTVLDDSRHTHNDTIYLTLLNKRGRSYTRNLYVKGPRYYTDNYIAEHCVIFSRDIDAVFWDLSPRERSATIAHEILHLFGAEDYYKPMREALADEHYFYDIMTLNTRNISRLQIMDMTAFSLGWTDAVPALCHNAQWKAGLQEIT